MPAQYEAMRDHFIREGMKTKLAKTKAAKIYNSRHPGAPMNSHHESSGSTGGVDGRGGARKTEKGMWGRPPI